MYKTITHIEQETMKRRVKKEEVIYTWVIEDLLTDRPSLVKMLNKAVNKKLREGKPSTAGSRGGSRGKLSDVQKKLANRKKILSKYREAANSRSTRFYNPTGVTESYTGNKIVVRDGKTEGKYLIEGSLAVPKSTRGAVDGFNYVRKALNEILSVSNVAKEYGEDAEDLAHNLRNDLSGIESRLGAETRQVSARRRRSGRQVSPRSAERISGDFSSSPSLRSRSRSRSGSRRRGGGSPSGSPLRRAASPPKSRSGRRSQRGSRSING